MKEPFHVYRDYSGNVLTTIKKITVVTETRAELLQLLQRLQQKYYSCDRDYSEIGTVVTQTIQRKCYSCDGDYCGIVTVVTETTVEMLQL